MAEQQQILSILSRIVETKEKVNLITIYKNIPLAFDAQTLNIENDIVKFKVNKYQLAAAVLVKDIFIQSETLSQHVKGQIVRMDPVKIILGVTNLAYAGDLRRRSAVRVEPFPPIPMLLNIYDSSVIAEIIDISTTGITIHIDPLDLTIPELPPGKLSARIEVQFKLPGKQLNPIALKCALKNVQKEAISGRYRMGLQIFPDKKTKTDLERFITEQQTKTMLEIKNLYEKSFIGGGIK
jgi:hypothetical protein